MRLGDQIFKWRLELKTCFSLLQGASKRILLKVVGEVWAKAWTE